MNIKSRPLWFAALITALFSALVTAAPSAVRTFNINANDTLRYNVSRIEASPGETIRIVLHNNGTVPKEVMGHNWVLLNQGGNPDAYVAAAMTSKGEDYQPRALQPEVLASVRTLGPGESADVTFAVPTTPGNYTYLCSFPAHCGAGMRGILVVR